MSVFNTYSVYYDALYQDKDYSAEAEYVYSRISENLLSKSSGGMRDGDIAREASEEDKLSILDLGCGTGLHLIQMAQKYGIKATGCDLSSTMLTRAADNFQRAEIECELINCKVQELKLDKKFSAVTSLFHVFSYQVSNQAALEFLQAANRHLDRGGIFMFDLWYGPAVLSERPEERIKHMTYQGYEVERICHPKLDVNTNTVEVNYTVNITERASGQRQSLQEQHLMRFFFKPEIELMAEMTGFRVLRAEEWVTKKSLAENSWGAAFILQKVS